MKNFTQALAYIIFYSCILGSIKIQRSFSSYKPDETHNIEGLFLLFRHGARTASRFPDPIFMKVGTPKISQLTTIGKFQIKTLAKKIIYRYRPILPPDISFIVSPSKRCRDSFWEFHKVFEEENFKMTPIIYFVAKDHDLMFHAKNYVKYKHKINEKIYTDPRFESQIYELQNTVDKLNNNKKVQESFHHYCSCCDNSTFEHQVMNYRFFYSYFISLYHNNLKKFEVDYETLLLTKKVFYLMTYLIDNYPLKFTKLMANEFINYIGNQALTIVKGNWAYYDVTRSYESLFKGIYDIETKAFTFFSGHDHNIIPLLFLFILSNETDLSFLVEHPEFEVKFASYLSIEFYSLIDSKENINNKAFQYHKIFINIIFNDRIIKLKSCGYQNCELEEFLKLLVSYKHPCKSLECVSELNAEDFFENYL